MRMGFCGRRVLFLVGLCVLGTVAVAHAFMPNPDLLVISPSSAKAGETVEVTVSGTDLDDLRTLRFADPGIKVAPVTLPPEDLFPVPRIVPDRFKVTVPIDAKPGLYEVRTLGFFGLSTARPFLVLSKDAVELREEGAHATRESALPITVEAGVSGTLDNRGIDWYRFPGRKGERLLIHVLAERLDSKADCMLALSDASGRELEGSRHHFGSDPLVDFTVPSDGDYFLAISDSLYRGGAEYFYRLQVTRTALIDFVFPPAGLPGQKCRFTFFGRNLPGGSLGDGLEWEGKPLETVAADLPVPGEPSVPEGIRLWKPRQSMLPVFEHRLGNSDAVSIGFATAPVVVEDPKSELQTVSVPCEVAGRFDRPGDADAFRFKAQKGQTWWIEAISDRLGTAADPLVVLEKITPDPKGGEVYTKVLENDDPPTFYSPDALDDLNADTLDCIVSFTADEDGEYRVTLINQSAGGSPAHLYRLAIRQPRPDFQLLSSTERTKTINNDAYPASPVLRPGGSLVYRIIALRHDAHQGDITVTVSGLPEGVTSRPLVLSGATDQGFVTVQAPPTAKSWQGKVKIEGVAMIDGKEVRREARNGALVWGKRVFANQAQVRSRVDEEIVLSILDADSEAEPATVAPAEDKVWTVAMNQSLEIPVKVTDTGRRQGSLQVEAHGFPGMLRGAPSISIAEGQTEGKLVIDCKPSGNFKIAPGRYQFVLQGVGNAKYRRNPAAEKSAAAEAKRVEALVTTIANENKRIKDSLAAAKKASDEATQRAAGAADDAARTSLAESVASTKAALDAATKAVADSDAKVAKVAALKTAADKAAQVAADKAKEQTMQFATYSLPITVEVTAPPEKQ